MRSQYHKFDIDVLGSSMVTFDVFELDVVENHVLTNLTLEEAEQLATELLLAVESGRMGA